MSNDTNSHKSWPIVLLALNAIGASVYVLLASRGGWVIRQECEAGINTTTGEPFVWFGSIAPAVTIFFLLNLAWGVMILRRRQWIAGRMWLATAAIWMIAAYIDFSHHQC
jgi:hypothetical protein